MGNGAQESGAEQSGPREIRVWKNMDVTQTNVWTCLASSFFLLSTTYSSGAQMVVKFSSPRGQIADTREVGRGEVEGGTG